MTRRRAAAPAAGLVLAAVLAGCTGGSAAGGSSASAGASSAGPTAGSPAGTGAASVSGPPAPPPAPVPSQSRATLAPVPAKKPVEVGGRARATLVSARTVKVTGRGPGELSGPAVALTLSVVNGPGKALDLATVTVTAAVAGQEASPSDSPPVRPFKGVLKPGASATGVYVFVLPGGKAGTVAAVVSLSPDLPVARFTVRS